MRQGTIGASAIASCDAGERLGGRRVTTSRCLRPALGHIGFPVAAGHGGARTRQAAGVGVERDNEAANTEPAAGHADHDLPVDGERRHRDVVASGRVRNQTFPDDRPSHRLQRDHRRVDGTDEDLVVVQGNATIHLVAVHPGIRRRLPDVAPPKIAGLRVEREHLKAACVQRGGDAHVPVVDDGRRLVVPVRAGGEGPDGFEGGDVGRRDAIERTVAPAVVGAAVHRPVVRPRVQEPLGGHGRVVGIGRRGLCVHRDQALNRDDREEVPEA